MKLALAMIVKGSEEEAEQLKTCFKYVAHFVDKIYITITYGKDKSECAPVEDVCNAYGAEISYWRWTYSFADARNYNFSQVREDYILWLDADDVVRYMDKVKPILLENPDVDIFTMNYLYSFDEWKNPDVVHIKSQIIKNNGCVEWYGDLHEDFKPLRQVKIKHISDVDRLHLSKHERFEEAKKRNLVVSRKQLKKNPNDPRSFWNVANSLKALGQNEEAIVKFKEFIKLSESDNEKYIAYLRIAESLWILGQRYEAIDQARYAIGIFPEYPDAYNLIGSLYLETKQFEKAVRSFKIALSLKPPYYEILVYNPRDYDYVPLMNLAKGYFQMNMPTLALEALKQCKKIYPKDNKLNKVITEMEKEADKFEAVIKEIEKIKKIKDKVKLFKKIDSLPIELQSHPAICNIRNVNFVKEKSSGKDLVIFCGYTTEEWTPETAKTKGIGGSEEAVIHLSKGLVERGWNVSVYNNCGHQELDFDGVKYKPFWSWNYRDKQDVVILWRHPKMADYEINAGKVIVDLHDVIQDGEFSKERLERIDKVFVKSAFHKSLFPSIPEKKFVVVPNGIVSSIFAQESIKDPYLMINTSSPDRSIRGLIECFKEVKKQVPEAKCKWAYGWGVFDVVHGNNPKIMEWKDKMVKEMEEAGIENLGRISHEEVADLYKQASIFAYPSEFAEIDCISLSKAMAAGAYPITTDFAAMGEKDFNRDFIKSKKTKDNWYKDYQYDFSMDNSLQKEWVDKCVERLKNPKDTKEMEDWAKNIFDWEKIINIWNKNL